MSLGFSSLKNILLIENLENRQKGNKFPYFLLIFNVYLFF